MAQVGKGLVALDGVGHDVAARQLLALGHEAPAALGEEPVHDGEADDVFEPLELARDEGAVRLTREETRPRAVSAGPGALHEIQ